MKFLSMKPLSRGFLISLAIHVAVYGVAVGIIAWGEAHAEYQTNIDQSNAPLLMLDTKPITPPKPWIMAKKTLAVPTPLVQPTPTPDPDTGAIASRLPSLQGGFIDESDYPIEMRKEKKEGTVIAELLIDIEGNVKSVSIVQGSDPAFNEVVLEKLKDAKFRPALDKTGQPMNCRVRLPVGFKLD